MHVAAGCCRFLAWYLSCLRISIYRDVHVYNCVYERKILADSYIMIPTLVRAVSG
jgi:hypothetical protein